MNNNGSTTAEKAIRELLGQNPATRDALVAMKRRIAKKFGIPILKSSAIFSEYKKMAAAGRLSQNPILEGILRKRTVRTLSGVAPVAVLTKPYPCPGKCAYCPTEKNVPQSYLSNEPAVMRAIRCSYEPYRQVQLRLKALENNGHCPNKIELIVIGGTWSVLPKNYKYWYIGNCFKAANDYSRKAQSSKPKAQSPKLKTESLKKFLLAEQKRNEKAEYKIIGLTLETRPDYISDKELLEMRELGCTRVELGVQAIDDNILKLNKRGHGVEEIVSATKLLKDSGFKVTYHFMPGLPGSDPKNDLRMFSRLFTDERFQPDQIKIYPTVVTKGSLLYRWWKDGKYKPYSSRQLNKLIIDIKKNVPPHVRIIRLIRDIPGESIVAGNKATNLRQVMKDKGADCRCIRCREAKDKNFLANDSKLSLISYRASGGEEYFISYTSNDEKILYGFCRLRLQSGKPGGISLFPGFLKGAAIIRELHVYGELTQIGSKGKVQHIGIGKKLMEAAEKLAIKKGRQQIAVIAGIGVRNYYRSLGYKLQAAYMVKK